MCPADIKQSIESMYREIRNYNGNFGDPICLSVEFNPFEVLQNGDSSCRCGAAIGLLVNFVSHVDNSTYEDALLGEAASDIKYAIAKKYFTERSSLDIAMKACLKSEQILYASLLDVYNEHIRNDT